MKKIVTIIAISTLSIATLIGCGKKQKIIFEVESILFKSEWSKPDVQKECSKLSENLSSHINNGWRKKLAKALGAALEQNIFLKNKFS